MTRVALAADHRPRIEPYVPYWSHLSSGVVLLEDGTRLAMARVRGIPHELCDAEQRNTSTELLNRIWRDIGDDNVTVCVHLVRDKAPDDHYREIRFRNDFSRKLHRALYEALIHGKLYTNDWYVSLLISPRGVPIGTKALQRKISKFLYQFRQKQDRQLADTSEIEGLWLQLARNLERYSVERLGYRYNDTRYGRYRFSEIGEAMKRFLGLASLPSGAVPITTGRLGNGICTDADQPIFERRIYRILPPGCDDDSDNAEGVRWGQLFGIKDYMEESGPDLLDAVLSLDMPLVVSHHFCFAAKANAVAHLVRTRNQMKASKDAAIKARRGLKKAASKAQGGEERRGDHDLSIAVYAPSYSALLKNAATAQAALVDTGAQIIPETGGNLSQYYGQLPGNFRYCAHPGKIGSRDFVNLANFGSFPRGSKDGKWGPAMMSFATTANTRYDFVPHVGDVGHAIVFGAIGSGKTVLLAVWMALADQYMAGNNGIIIVLDKDQGCRVVVEAMRGNYLVIQRGEPSGLMPLQGFREDTPYARSCLVRLAEHMVTSDRRGPMPPIDGPRVECGIAAMLRLPVEERNWWRFRQFLGWDDPMGAGPRIERWCHGRELGWLFDGGSDRVHFDAPIVGFDLGRILNLDTELEVATEYLTDRMTPVVDGRRAVGLFDESHRYMLRPIWADKFDDFSRTWRKLNGYLVLATQQPEDYLGTAVGRAILAQCPTMGFFPTSGASKEVYCGNEQTGGLGCTEGEFEAISARMAPGSRQFLLKRRGIRAESVICKFDLGDLDPWFLHVLSGTANRVRLWNELREKFPNALDAFAERSREAVD